MCKGVCYAFSQREPVLALAAGQFIPGVSLRDVKCCFFLSQMHVCCLDFWVEQRLVHLCFNPESPLNRKKNSVSIGCLDITGVGGL